MSESWYISFDQQQQGPFTREQLGEMAGIGQINLQTLVWTEGMPGWIQAGQLSWIFPASPYPSQSAHYPPPGAPAAGSPGGLGHSSFTGAVYPAPGMQPAAARKKNSPLTIIILILAATAGVLAGGWLFGGFQFLGQ